MDIESRALRRTVDAQSLWAEQIRNDESPGTLLQVLQSAVQPRMTVNRNDAFVMWTNTRRTAVFDEQAA
jgi:hypothetical protein